MTAGFVSAGNLLERGPQGLVRSVERVLWHLGFSDVRVIDGANDGGADILGIRNRQQWVVQCKWSSRGPVDRSGVDDIERARTEYGADRAVLATNTFLNRPAVSRIEALRSVGIDMAIWSGQTLSAIGQEMPERFPAKLVLRDYQDSAVRAVERDLDLRQRALLILATGLGKTVVGGEVIGRYLQRFPQSQVLIVAHMKELVDQLEKAMWRHLNKQVMTQAIHSDSLARSVEGVTVATVDAALRLVKGGYAPDLVMVDETHHVGEQGMFSQLLDDLVDSQQFGVTATPWRGDKFDITQRFGAPSYSLGIAEGMKRGFLASVDYRIFVDDLDWEFVRALSQKSYSIKDLNRSLFLPQRDEQIIDELRSAWQNTREPRCIVFCQTIEHAERMAGLLRAADPSWARATYLHAELSRQKRQIVLNAFRIGRIPIITCVDVFNEGVDVPDVNLIAFLRVTHSRRIFVQQLGRGLRLREGKDSLLVLDFVTDIRRIAATLDLSRSLVETSAETVKLPEGISVRFSDETAGSLMDYWIQDAASLETSSDEVQLNFPLPAGLD